MMRNIVFTWSRLAALALLVLPAGVCSVAASAKPPVIAKWGRFEHSFKSTVLYSNAVQDVSLRVGFKSPLGEMSEVVTASCRAFPRVAEQNGFRFRYPQLGEALAAAL